jgi:hypothetical protein
MELPEETTDDLRIMTEKIGMLVSKVSERLNISAEEIAEHVLHHKDTAVRGRAKFSEIRLENFLRSKVGMGGQSHLAATKMIDALIYYTNMETHHVLKENMGGACDTESRKGRYIGGGRTQKSPRAKKEPSQDGYPQGGAWKPARDTHTRYAGKESRDPDSHVRGGGWGSGKDDHAGDRQRDDRGGGSGWSGRGQPNKGKEGWSMGRGGQGRRG